jgi:hypothetical protein
VHARYALRSLVKPSYMAAEDGHVATNELRKKRNKCQGDRLLLDKLLNFQSLT